MGARGADADVIVAVGERGRVPLHLAWVRGEECYARVKRDPRARPRARRHGACVRACAAPTTRRCHQAWRRWDTGRLDQGAAGDRLKEQEPPSVEALRAENAARCAARTRTT